MSATTRKGRPAGKRAAATRRPRARTAAPTSRRAHGLNASEIVAFVATADSARAREFYGSVMGLRLVADEPFALVFDANGVMLRVQKVEAVSPVAYTTVGWKVADIATTIRGLIAKGVVFERYSGLSHDDLGVWTSPRGARVAWFKDPDGNVLSLTQF